MTRREETEQAAMQVGGVHPDWDALECFRVGYKEGAKWADKTLIKKAYEWIISNMPKYVKANKLDIFINNEDMANAFKRAMEE